VKKISFVDIRHFTSLADRKVSLGSFSILALFLAILSSIETGFYYGKSNNIFHIPIVLKLYDLPQFADDAFYQSLRYYSSLLWPLLATFTTEATASTVFLLVFVVSRLILFIALLWLAFEFGARTIGTLGLAGLFLVATHFLKGVSPVGAHDLFIDYLSHTTLATALLLLSMLTQLRGYWLLSCTLAGLAFSTNAILGIWALSIIIVIRFAGPSGILRQNIPLYSLVGLALGALAFLLTASPALLWIVKAKFASGMNVDFDYRAFIMSYFPDHFLIHAASPTSIGALIIAVVIGFYGIMAEGLSRPWRAAWWALLGIFCFGIILPYLFNSRDVFNLHLLRIDGVITYWVVTYLAATLATSLTRMDRLPDLGVAPLFASFAFIMGSWPVMLAALLGLWWRTSRSLHLAFVFFCLIVGIMNFWLTEAALVKSLGWFAAATIIATFTLASGMRSLVWWVVGLISFTAFAICLTSWRLMGLGEAKAALVPVVGLAILFLPIRYRVWAHKHGFGFGLGLSVIAVAALISVTIVKPYIGAGPARVQLAADWKEMAEWIRHNNIEGPILVPTHGSFDTLSGDNRLLTDIQMLSRAKIWVTWKQGGAVMWQPGFFHQWDPRFKEVSAFKKPTEFLEYACKNRIPLVALEREELAPTFPVTPIFMNRSFMIIPVRSDVCARP
jgi:hypothetical protein